MAETRKIAAILVADIVGYSRLAGADEDRTLARLRALRSDLIDPTIAVYHGRIVKRTGDGSLIEFRSVVDAVRCAIEVQNGLIERNAGLPPERRIEFRVGIHLGDVVEESDGDLMGDGVNIAARLEGVCEPGAICLSEDAYRQVKGRLDLAVSDLGPTRLKNIAEPIRVYSLEVGKPVQPKPATQAQPAQPKRRSSLAPLALGIAALLIVVAASAWYLPRENRPTTVVTNAPVATASNAAAPAEAPHLSIVVLPFENLSGDKGQDYFVDGITDNITTDLARVRNSFVIAHETALTFKGKGVDAKEIGKELGVRYVLEGSVQRDQNRVRINAQLIDADTGAHLWADRFEKEVADLFKLQDEVVARLANPLGWELMKAEAAKGARSKSPDAIDLTMRGWFVLTQGALSPTKDNTNAARALFDQALAIDPNDADALAGEVETYMLEYGYGWRTPGTDYDAKIIAQADRAIALDPGAMLAYWAKGLYLMNLSRPDEALRDAEAGLAVDPNFARLYVLRGLAKTALGRFEEGKSEVQYAMRLSPRDGGIGYWLTILSRAELGLGNYDAAIDACRKSIDGGYRSFIAYESLAAALALDGQLEEAKAAEAEARRLNPKLTIKWLHSTAGALPPPVFEGLRKAGLPEE
jgi:adenylate cyclase